MFCYRKRYNDPINQAVVKKVITETRSLDPTVCAMNVTGTIAQGNKNMLMLSHLSFRCNLSMFSIKT